jgi:hypothetical protein
VRTTFVIPSLLLLLACQPKPTEPSTTQSADQPVVEPDSGKPVTASEVTLSPLEQEVTVAVGTTLLYSYKSHASVGLGARQTVADEAVVKYVRTDTEYEQSEADREGKTGADAATGTFVFEAVAVGTTTVTIEELMRGTVEQSATFTITVSAP